MPPPRKSQGVEGASREHAQSEGGAPTFQLLICVIVGTGHQFLLQLFQKEFHYWNIPRGLNAVTEEEKNKIRQTSFEESEEPDTPGLNKLCYELLGLTEASSHLQQPPPSPLPSQHSTQWAVYPREPVPFRSIESLVIGDVVMHIVDQFLGEGERIRSGVDRKTFLWSLG